VIGAHKSELNATVVSPTAVAVATECPSSSGDCTYTNPSTTDDVWIATEFSATAAPGSKSESESDTTGAIVSVQCLAGQTPVCSWALNQTTGAAGGSCGFFVAAGAAVHCTTVGKLSSTTAHAQQLSGKILAGAASGTPGASQDRDGQAECPIVTGEKATTMCDCGKSNAAATDIVVAVRAESIDDGFNSFHCFVDGANVCAFGTNENNRFNAGGCYFVVAAGDSYSECCTLSFSLR
jgi:hypothetical protein